MRPCSLFICGFLVFGSGFAALLCPRLGGKGNTASEQQAKQSPRMTPRTHNRDVGEIYLFGFSARPPSGTVNVLVP
jgi:hypothetical protein